MAKIDVTKIDGFENLDAEAKVNALLNYEYEVPTPAKESDDGLTARLKEALDKASAQAADYKRQLREKQTADEAAEAEKKEAFDKLSAELNTLRRERTVSNYTNKFMASGYDVDTAKAMASQLPDGIDDSFFDNQKQFLNTKTQEIKATLLNQQPQLTEGKPLSAKDLQDAEIETIRKYAGL